MSGSSASAGGAPAQASGDGPWIDLGLAPGRARYWPHWLDGDAADRLLALLDTGIAWRQPVVRLFGRTIRSPRLAAWHGDPEAVYRYSGLVNEPQPWTAELDGIRRRLEAELGAPFNSVLLNRYRDGGDSMGWHSDDEPELGPDPLIASLSLGSTRRFLLKPRRGADRRRRALALGHGSLLVMDRGLQHHWRHSVPRSRRAGGIRINLTFRLVVPVAERGAA